jgi:competence protein ComFC
MTPAGQPSPAYFFYRFFWNALDWIFPPICGGCQLTGERWCEACQRKVTRITGNICPRCGDPRHDANICPDCAHHPPEYTQLRSFGLFQGTLREAMHRLKYQQDIGLGEALSKHLIELYNQEKWAVDCIVPVPLSSHRLKERGYNQASLLARPLALAVRKPYRPDILHRVRDTRSQVGLTAVERRANVEDAFSSEPRQVKGKTILIVDDVTTTGSTINACAQALCASGASAVFGLTLSRAVLQADADDRPKPSHSIWR